MNNFQYLAADENGFKNIVLDNLLAAGFYRMHHMVFTCNDTITSEGENSIPVFWLRTLVRNCKLHGSASSILKKCAGFSVSVQQAYTDDEVEDLYAEYKNHVPFTVTNTCAGYLHQQHLPDPFDSMMVQVRHNNELIAAGYFDKGRRAIAGIMNIYHPQYKAYSLGKFLMLQKLKYTLSKDMIYYYTGYISTENPRFDYKVFPDQNAVEILLPVEQKWVPYHLISKQFLAEYYARFLAV